MGKRDEQPILTLVRAVTDFLDIFYNIEKKKRIEEWLEKGMAWMDGKEKNWVKPVTRDILSTRLKDVE